MWRELRERGYPGGGRQVSRWAEGQRERDPGATFRDVAGRPPACRPSVPRLAWLLARDPSGLDDGDLALLGRLQAACPAAATAYPLLQAFARMVKERAPDGLDAWLTVASACGVPDVASFAKGLGREEGALRAALTLPWSTGPVEGQITRLKLIKR